MCQSAWDQKRGPFTVRPSYDGTVIIVTASLSQTAVWHLYACPRPGGNLPLSVLPRSPFRDTVFMTAINVQKPSFVIDRVHFDLDSQQGLSLGPVRPCSEHFTQLSLNPVRGIGFRRSGISLGFTIWNHISFSFSDSPGISPPTNGWAHLQSLLIYLFSPFIWCLNSAPDNTMNYCPAKDVCNLSKLLCSGHANSPN